MSNAFGVNITTHLHKCLCCFLLPSWIFVYYCENPREYPRITKNIDEDMQWYLSESVFVIQYISVQIYTEVNLKKSCNILFFLLYLCSYINFSQTGVKFYIDILQLLQGCLKIIFDVFLGLVSKFNFCVFLWVHDPKFVLIFDCFLYFIRQVRNIWKCYISIIFRILFLFNVGLMFESMYFE